ncbi:unnamed protein product [Arctia plantaginis]|uniref:Carboxylesterase type B domain-containing protein n=1 Tax=Arctia plantaginis TaxID=874455 RepID=A0A8S1A572_ARCPL|nr:unnamed protein product [Arctia plantaginis]
MWLHNCLRMIFLVHIVSSEIRIDPLVNTNVGLIRGLRANDGDYSMFLGIPFAKVDVNNPFGPSTPYPEFESTFEAYDDSIACPQLEEFNNTLIGSLDCLNLNIFVPSSATSNNLQPVLVWIHGGAFQIGFNNRYLYGPNFLVKHDIILVTINYRLGPYDQITTMWTNFVKSGNPMSQNLDNVSVQWTPITNTLELPYLNIGAELTLDSRPFNQRASFWDLFYKVNEHLQIVYPSAKVEL